MRAAACLCRSILRGTEKSVPRSDRAYKAPGDPGKQYQRLATATVVVTAATAAEAGQILDPISTLAVEDLINELKNEYTIVIVTHNMQQAARIADYTAFFNLKAVGQPGHLEYFTDTTTMFNNPQNEEAERYVSGRFG